jgi:hypothetical protein
MRTTGFDYNSGQVSGAACSTKPSIQPSTLRAAHGNQAITSNPDTRPLFQE